VTLPALSEGVPTEWAVQQSSFGRRVDHFGRPVRLVGLELEE
jgi:hypothetical protein